MTNREKKIKKLFPFQREDEKVIMLLRRHWIILGKFILVLGLLNLVPAVVGIFIFGFLGWDLQLYSLPYILLVLGLSLYYLIVWLYYFHEFVDYHLDIWIVTDQRIINIEQIGLFNRVISELNILKVQDVTSEVKGKAQTMINYGNVYIQTAGETQRFVFSQVKNPPEVARLVTRAHDDALRKSSPEELVRLQEERIGFQPITMNKIEDENVDKAFKQGQRL